MEMQKTYRTISSKMNQSVGIWETLLRLRALDTFLLAPPLPPSAASKRADVGCSRTLLSFLFLTDCADECVHEAYKECCTY